MDLSSDTSHLYDDSKFNDIGTKLDMKNRLETKHQNKREDKNYQLTARIIDRSSSIVNRDHEREIKMIREGLQDIYVKTPYFNTFWKMQNSKAKDFQDGESVKDAVINRILRRNRKRETIETVPEDSVLNVTNQSFIWDSESECKTVRRTKSEPNFCQAVSSEELILKKKRRLRSESLGALRIDKTERNGTVRNTSSVPCLFPLITDANKSNKDLTKYDPIAFPKPNPKRRSASVPELTDVSTRPLKSQVYLRKADIHSKALGGIYMKRLKPIVSERTVAAGRKGLVYESLPENATLRAHFISQANRIGYSEYVYEEDYNDTYLPPKKDSLFDY